ncbi:SDR family oxidoreductase [Streptomyces sp. NPDC088350]|uniref:SDR family oxidoreductase n=1 Tax=Streptomyces sp. NPDC088350 TaxID=3365854 RepID=UPI003801C747
MRVFVTGATGYIGSAVVRELLEAGHQVLGLARSDSAADTLTRAGVDVQRGDIDDGDSLRAGAAAADGVIYAANQHISETTDSAARAKAELNAVDAIGAELEGTGKPFVVTSGVIGRTPGELLTEDTPAVPNLVTALRLPVELSVLALGERGVRSSSVRLAPTVHGRGDARGFISTLIGVARTTGVSAFVGDGANRWPSVHRLDAATLYRLALESAPAGTPLHAVGEEGVPFREIAQAIGRQLKVPAISMTPEEAGQHFVGFLAPLVALDNPASSALTQRRMEWRPTHPALVPDIEEGHYFEESGTEA